MEAKQTMRERCDRKYKASRADWKGKKQPMWHG